MDKKQKILIALLLLSSGMLGFIFSFYQHQQAKLVAVVQPMVPPVLETFHSPALFVKQLEHDPAAGEKIFKEFCAVCHANPPAIHIQAPRIGDKKAWALRRQRGMQALMQVTLMGVGAMPARGGCFECSDDQLRASIQYILKKSS